MPAHSMAHVLGVPLNIMSKFSTAFQFNEDECLCHLCYCAGAITSLTLACLLGSYLYKKLSNLKSKTENPKLHKQQVNLSISK